MRWSFVAVLMAFTARGAERVALLVSNDIGLSEDAALHHTASDADRVAAVLTELGQFSAADVHRVSDKSAAELLGTLDQLALAGAPLKTFFFYYSGHADASALHLAGTTLPFEALQAHLRAIRADLHVSILDACQSGGATRAKGVAEGPAFDVQIDDHSPEGNIVITSSAPDEQSYESDEARGAIFTTHWTSGLRGAADRDGDNLVTLGEAYGYAYAQTLRATVLSRTGPQHPTYKWDITGRRDPVLTMLNASAHLTVISDDDASYILFDAQERAVVTELPVSGGDKRRIALAPGEYVVKKRGTRGLAVARVQLGKDDDRLLYGDQMRSVPFVRLARKGAFGDVWFSAETGQYASALGATGHPHVNLGVEWDKGRWLFPVGLVLAIGSEWHDGLTTLDTVVGVTAGALISGSFGLLVLRGGPAAGLLYVRQDSGTAPSRGSLAALLGVRVRVDLQIAERVCLFAGFDAMAELVPVVAAPAQFGFTIGKLGVLGFGAYSIGLRLSW